MRLAALELLDKLQLCYGIRMLEVMKEVDLFPSLLKMYVQYPYNDVALRYVTNLILHSLDHKAAKELDKKSAPPQRPSRMLDLEPIEVPAETAEEETIEDEETRRSALLVYFLFSTPLTEMIVKLCVKEGKLSYHSTKNQVEMGYVAHLSRLASVITKLVEADEDLREQFSENTEWVDFEKTYLKPREELRSGSLCRGQQFEKKEKSRFISMFDDDEEEPE